MREPSSQRLETRRRIVDAADALFRERGIDGVGVDAIMRAAGMTHGGFYFHFPSKEALVAAVSAEQLARSAARWSDTADRHPQAEALDRVVTNYLHDRNIEPSNYGCVLPALGPELARRPESRTAVTEAIRQMLAALTRMLPFRSRARAEKAAMATLSTLVGAVVLARLSSDPVLSGAILQAAREQVLPRRNTRPSAGADLC